MCRDRVKKPKVKALFTLAQHTKNHKGFYRYVNQNGKVREGIPTLDIQTSWKTASNG